MMDYNLFKSVIMSRINSFLPPMFADFEPAIESVRKVNETKDALILKPANEGLAKALPMTYLDDMYELFQENEDLDQILQMIASLIVNFTGYYTEEDIEFDFKEKKDKIIMNLVNSEKNQELLQSVPHIDVANMSIIYRMIVNEEEDGFNSLIINKNIMDSIGVSEKELHQLAVDNTRRLFPEHLVKLDDGIVVISNVANLFGSVSVLYKEVMRKVCQMIGSEEFYVIPSSIHEVIAVSKDVTDLEDLLVMLAEGNSSVTMERDVLSNSIYVYNLKRGSLAKVASYRQKAC